MRFAVEAWAPDYGASVDVDDPVQAGTPVDVEVEVPADRWAPTRPPHDAGRPEVVAFTDGVRRIEAAVWIDADDGGSHLGVCASWAAGVVRCDGSATVVASEVERGVFSAAPRVETIRTRHASFPPGTAKVDRGYAGLALAVQKRMGQLEARLARRAADAEVVVVDGPLRAWHDVPGAVGYVKSHNTTYLPDVVADVVGRLAPGERTPLFRIMGDFSRLSWYARLPGTAGHRWAGIVRCEVSADLEVGRATAAADGVTALLPRFASAPHKDPRAPQNLYPIAGLERELRRRMGDPALLYRSLRLAAAG